MTRDELDAAIEDLVALHRSGASAKELWARQFDLGLAWADYDLGAGGQALDQRARAEVWGRLATAGLPHPRNDNFVGIGMAAELIHAHGSEPHRQRHLRATFCNDHVWCQLFSEPSAGSDLANVSTTAVADGGSWIVNGQKVWTSFAHRAQFGLLLARSDTKAPKHAGLTMFLLDMATPGIDVRPLRMMTGDAEFNEVFLDDVVVPDTCRIGAAGEGWRMTVAVLMHERAAVGGIGTARRGSKPIDRALDDWRRDPGTAVERDSLARLWIESRLVELTKARAAASIKRGTPGPEGSVLRILATELNARVHDFLVRRPQVGLVMPNGYPDGLEVIEGRMSGKVQREFLFSRGLMIGGGTLEISRNVIAERVLGLPPDPASAR